MARIVCPVDGDFDADAPHRSVEKPRWPEGQWIGGVHVREGRIVIETLDIYECPTCGSPVAIPAGERDANDEESEVIMEDTKWT